MATGAVIGAAVIGAVSSRNSSRRAASAQRSGQQSAEDAARTATQQAARAAIPLFAVGQQNALQGFQGALDTFSQTLPGQAQAAQQGNLGAQQALLAGLPQFQNAILGDQVDFSQLQPSQADPFDFSSLNFQLPEFTGIQDALNPFRSLGDQFTGGAGFQGIVSPGAGDLGFPQGFGISGVGAQGGFGAGPGNSLGFGGGGPSNQFELQDTLVPK